MSALNQEIESVENHEMQDEIGILFVWDVACTTSVSVLENIPVLYLLNVSLTYILGYWLETCIQFYNIFTVIIILNTLYTVIAYRINVYSCTKCCY